MGDHQKQNSSMPQFSVFEMTKRDPQHREFAFSSQVFGWMRQWDIIFPNSGFWTYAIDTRGYALFLDGFNWSKWNSFRTDEYLQICVFGRSITWCWAYDSSKFLLFWMVCFSHSSLSLSNSIKFLVDSNFSLGGFMCVMTDCQTDALFSSCTILPSQLAKPPIPGRTPVGIVSIDGLMVRFLIFSSGKR